MMSPLIVSMFLLSSILSIDCQSIHFCKALEDNEWKIDYSMSVPNGTFHRKFLIIKQHYWELDYSPDITRRKRQNPSLDFLDINSDDETEEQTEPPVPFIKGPVSLKNVWSKQSDWLSGDYQLGFSIRFGGSNTQWKQTVLGLIDLKNQKFDWSLFDPNFSDFSEGSPKKSTPLNFGDFKPQIAFITYSGQKHNSIVFIEQKYIGKPSVNLPGSYETNKYDSIIRVYNTTDPSKGLEYETDESWIEKLGAFFLLQRKNVQKAIKKMSAFYKLKGMFGISTPDTNDKSLSKNSTIFLIEHCPTFFIMSPGATDGHLTCNTSIRNVYCIAEEADDNPFNSPKKCHPAAVSIRQLIDCSKPDDWMKAPAPHATSSSGVISKQKPSKQGSVPSKQDSPPHSESKTDIRETDIIRFEAGVEESVSTEPSVSVSPSAKTAENSGALVWIIVIIVIIVIIIIVVVILLLCCRRGADEDSGGPKPKPGDVDSETSEDIISRGGSKVDSSSGSAKAGSSSGSTKSGSTSSSSKSQKRVNTSMKKAVSPDSLAVASVRSNIKQ